jgi:hypothetical protein
VIEFRGRASDGKHFESRGPARLRGVYLEKLYEMIIYDCQVLTASIVDAMPLKAITSNDLPSSFLPDCRVLCSPAMSQIINLDGLGEHCAGAARRYVRFSGKGLANYAST